MTSFVMDEQSSILNSTPVAEPPPPESPIQTFQTPANVSSEPPPDNHEPAPPPPNDENNGEKHESTETISSPKENKDEIKEKIKADKKAAKRLLKELTICKIILDELEVGWEINFHWDNFDIFIHSTGSRGLLAILITGEHQTISHLQESDQKSDGFINH